MGDELVEDIRRALSDPRKVAELLGLKVHPGGAGYVKVCCPAHAERTPSCSIRRVEGAIGVRCFGCEWTGDVFSLIAAVERLGSFPDQLRRAAELAGRPDLADQVGRGADPDRPRAAPPPRQDEPAEPERDYPDHAELEALWGALTRVDADPEASAHLAARRIDPGHVSRLDLARTLHPRTATDRLPEWARYRGAWWRDIGHRLIVRVFDCEGAWRSVRSWRVRDGDSPKRLPPAGRKAAGLVLANPRAVAMLEGGAPPCQIVVCEGEPDWLVRSTMHSDRPVFGVLSGGWHEGFGARVPYGSEVVVRTHLDAAGERYALAVIASVRGRAQVSRLVVQQEPEPEVAA